MKRLTAGSVALLISLACPVVMADDVTLDSVPPVVVKTVPEAGATVDPKLTEIKVTYSKDMGTGMSWTTLSKDSFPKLNGKAKWLDKRTCVLPVKLEAGKTYATWLNSETFTNFKDSDGNSAVPYLLVFKTKK